MTFEPSELFWIHEPRRFTIDESAITITTEPGTDLWQRTYYGFQNDNAPALLMKVTEQSFSFSVRTQFDSKAQYDQCGIILYQDSENWVKASIEYEDEKLQRLGSVVTSQGYSDWATTDLAGQVKAMSYRLSRRGQDFKIEHASDGKTWQQMRIFHLPAATGSINLGIYACSPKQSSFKAVFTDVQFQDCQWRSE